jgi:hypothetical protein
MAREFANAEQISDARKRIEDSARTVSELIKAGLMPPASDLEVVWLMDYVQALQSFLEDLFVDEFGRDDGRGLLEGSHDRQSELAHRIDQLLERNGIAWLTPALVEQLEAVAREGWRLLHRDDASIVPVGDSDSRARRLNWILALERAGEFCWLSEDSCSDECGGCESRLDHLQFVALVARLQRNLDRRDPRHAARRLEAREIRRFAMYRELGMDPQDVGPEYRERYPSV